MTIPGSSSTQSLLGQALAATATPSIPIVIANAAAVAAAAAAHNHHHHTLDNEDLDHDEDPSQNSSLTPQATCLIMPIHSDFTVPISNCRRGELGMSPPEDANPSGGIDAANGNNHNNDTNSRRSVLGGRVQHRYYRYRPQAPPSQQSSQQQQQQQSSQNHRPQHQMHHQSTTITLVTRSQPHHHLLNHDDSDASLMLYPLDPDDSTLSSNDDDEHSHHRPLANHHHNNSILSDLSPPCSPPLESFQQNHRSPETAMATTSSSAALSSSSLVSSRGGMEPETLLLSPPNTAAAATPNQGSNYSLRTSSSNLQATTPIASHRNSSHNSKNGHLLLSSTSSSSFRRKQQQHAKKHRPHETVHAQSLVLGIAFMAIWSPNNIMAPNLTQMAATFGFDDQQRDLFLGSYCALAQGVFSFPISAGLGLLTDIVPSRKYLFIMTVWGGALSSLLTGFSTTFPALIIFRLFNGGFMSASVPIAFSLLGDLFSPEERNAASSGLTAMMGMGIFFGQVYAGVAVGSASNHHEWPYPFHVSAALTFGAGCLVWLLVQEPVRGAKEPALQHLLQQGAGYNRKLTVSRFVHAMIYNRSNAILLWQGFFSSIPWGILFVFLNDFLSQEKGFSVPDATYLILVFGIGGAFGGILGGWWGQAVAQRNRAYLPVFMAVTTFLGIFPFLGLIHGTYHSAHGWGALTCCSLGGIIASLPSVNVRPCLINVNPPETRGAALTAANIIINVARGIGPSCITLLMSMFHLSRRDAFSVALSVFWTISAMQLFSLSGTLVEDEQAMEHELARYAAICILANKPHTMAQQLSSPMAQQLISPTASLTSPMPHETAGSVVGIEPFDVQAARESFVFVQKGITELGELGDSSFLNCHCGTYSQVEEEDGDDDDDDEMVNTTNYHDDLVQALTSEYGATSTPIMIARSADERRQLWRRQEQPTEEDRAIWDEESALYNERTGLLPK